MPVHVTVHAILRYAERALGVDVESARQRMARRDGRTPHDGQVMAHLHDTGAIDTRVIEASMLTPAVVLAASMGRGQVITPVGRIVVDQNRVVTFRAKDMKWQHDRPAQTPEGRYFKNGAQRRHRAA